MLKVLPFLRMLRCPRSFALTARLTVSLFAEAEVKAGGAFDANAGGQCGEVTNTTACFRGRHERCVCKRQ
ncbi:hypothetical protein KCU61_g755, partial [Aureobasidium melanogenum]